MKTPNRRLNTNGESQVQSDDKFVATERRIDYQIWEEGDQLRLHFDSFPWFQNIFLSSFSNSHNLLQKCRNDRLGSNSRWDIRANFRVLLPFIQYLSPGSSMSIATFVFRRLLPNDFRKSMTPWDRQAVFCRPNIANASGQHECTVRMIWHVRTTWISRIRSKRIWIETYRLLLLLPLFDIDINSHFSFWDCLAPFVHMMRTPGQSDASRQMQIDFKKRRRATRMAASFSNYVCMWVRKCPW
jgi:hypothetical protein